MERAPVLIAALAAMLTLPGCENPDFALGATISNDGIRPSIAASSGNVAVSVRP